jgi:sensor histidine kinase YesM
MIKSFYFRHQYFFNMLLVLVLVEVLRILDWEAWYPPNSPNRSDILLDQLFEFITLIPIIWLIIFNYKWAIKRKNYTLITVFTILNVALGPLLLLLISTWLEMALLNTTVLPITLNLIFRFTPMGSIFFLLFCTTFYLTRLKIQSEKERETAYNAETLAKDVQLKMLRYQINPHFLFNVLNSIYTLIDENTDKARKLVLDMSDYYRYTLNKQQHTITIEKEVESILKYLEIQKTRFEDEFHFEISVDDAVKPILIPSFLVHLLVENAVKYGTKSERQKLIIRLTIIMVNETLLIKVSNTGKLVSNEPDNERNSRGTGNGLENLKSRLALYYRENCSFSLKENNGWVDAVIEIKNING